MNEIAERNRRAAAPSVKAAIVAGNTWFALGEYAEALKRYAEARERMPVPNPGLLYQMALCYRYQGDLAVTEQYLRRVIEIAPEAAQVRALYREVQFLLRGQTPGN